MDKNEVIITCLEDYIVWQRKEDKDKMWDILSDAKFVIDTSGMKLMDAIHVIFTIQQEHGDESITIKK